MMFCYTIDLDALLWKCPRTDLTYWYGN